MNLKEYIKATGFENPEPKGVGIAILDSGFNVDNENVKYKFNAFDKSENVKDIYGHGTAIYEIINTVSPNAEYYLFKALDDTGKGSMLSIYEALIRCRDIDGIDIVCMSFSSFQKLSNTAQKALEECIAENKIIVSSLGNDGLNTPTYPSSVKGVYKVGSLSSENIHKRQEGTNFSADTHFVALGQDIFANGKMRSGTSFSTAVVVGQLSELIVSKEINPREFDYEKAKEFLDYDIRQLDNALGSLMKYEMEDVSETETPQKAISLDSDLELPALEFTDDDYNFVLDMYKDGRSSESIEDYLQGYDINFTDFIHLLLAKEIKRNNRKGKRISEDLKIIIANRDINGVSRSQIGQELHLNYLTIKRACENYGFGNKKMERTQDIDLYEKLNEPVKKVTDGIICPKCSKKANSVEESMNTYYCPECFEEYTVRVENRIETLYRTRWENID